MTGVPTSVPTAASRDLVDRLRRVRVPFRGRECAVVLRVPDTGEVVPLVLAPRERTAADVAQRLPIELAFLVESIDGREPGVNEPRELWNEPPAAAAILAARNALYQVLAERGTLLALCPHCARGEVVLGVVALVAALREGPWPIFDGPVYMAVPSLSTAWPRGARPAGAATAARLRFALPSNAVGLRAPAPGGVLGDLHARDGDGAPTREDAAWARWAPEGTRQPAGREYWRHGNPGFRALLRLTVALERLDGIDELSPAVVERFPVVDFYFLDNLYYLTHNVDVPDDTGAYVTCAECGERFLPVR